MCIRRVVALRLRVGVAGDAAAAAAVPAVGAARAVADGVQSAGPLAPGAGARRPRDPSLAPGLQGPGTERHSASGLRRAGAKVRRCEGAKRSGRGRDGVAIRAACDSVISVRGKKEPQDRAR